jgi:hypothetical protein
VVNGSRIGAARWLILARSEAPRRESFLIIIGNAGPPGTASKGSDKPVLANRLGQDQPETEENRDQRDAKP